MAALKGAAALCALALASGTLLGAEGEGERAWAQPAGPDGCPENMVCCAPSRYMGWLELEFSEAACVPRNENDKLSCGQIDGQIDPYNLYKKSHWVRAGTTGQTCRVEGPRFEGITHRGKTTWTRHAAKTQWAPGAVPPGGVGMHMDKHQAWIGAHWWPSVGAPCEEEDDDEDEARGCLLYDFARKAPMRALSRDKSTGTWNAQVDVNWHGAQVRGGHKLQYDEFGAIRKSHQWPFPAFCARASVSMLSLVYNPRFTERNLPAGAKVFFKRWAYDQGRCNKISYDEYRGATTRLNDPAKEKKACWNFVNDIQIVMCYWFRQCSCPPDRIEKCSLPESIDCCRGAFADFLTEEGLVGYYKNLTHEHAWALDRALQSVDPAFPTSDMKAGDEVYLLGPAGDGSHIAGVLDRFNQNEGRWQVLMGDCPSGYMCCAAFEFSVCVKEKDINGPRGGFLGFWRKKPACGGFPIKKYLWAERDGSEGAHRCSAGSPLFAKRDKDNGGEVWLVLPDPKEGTGEDRWVPLDGALPAVEVKWKDSALPAGGHFVQAEPGKLVLRGDGIILTIDGIRACFPYVTPMRQILDMYCEQEGVQAWQVDFMYRGVHIKRDASAKSLGMRNGAKITVKTKPPRVMP